MTAPGRLDLLDVNVWLALTHPAHAHHAAAKAYWVQAYTHSQTQLAFCRVSMLGFLRLVTMPLIMGDAVHSPAEAWEIYNAHLSSGRAVFVAEPASLDVQMRRYTSLPSFHIRDWTDAYLASFAVATSGRLVSFDKGFTSYDKLDFLQLKAG